MSQIGRPSRRRIAARSICGVMSGCRTAVAARTISASVRTFRRSASGTAFPPRASASSRARELAEALGGKAVPLADLRKVLTEADIVLAATAVRHPLITPQMLRAAIRRREGRPIWLIDLGFPRNVDPSCRTLAGVHVVDLDGLAPWGQRPPSPSAHARVEHRIRGEAERMIESLRPAASVDIAILRRKAEAVRRHEVEATLARLPDLSDGDRAVLDKLATRLVNRFLHGPTERLRSLPEGTRTEIVRQIVESLHRGPG